jgi:hypothetical protein
MVSLTLNVSPNNERNITNNIPLIERTSRAAIRKEPPLLCPTNVALGGSRLVLNILGPNLAITAVLAVMVVLAVLNTFQHVDFPVRQGRLTSPTV